MKIQTDQFCSALKQCLLEGLLRQVIVGNISVRLLQKHNSVDCEMLKMCSSLQVNVNSAVTLVSIALELSIYIWNIILWC